MGMIMFPGIHVRSVGHCSTISSGNYGDTRMFDGRRLSGKKISVRFSFKNFMASILFSCVHHSNEVP
jgi:hypothetical protein